MNTMSTEDIQRMWKPWTVYQNIEHADSVKTTEKPDIMSIIPHPGFKFKIDDRTNVKNTRLFKGSENVINYERQLTVNWVCIYDMRWYPFDSPTCTLRMFHTENTITLMPSSVGYSGPMELTQHFVKNVQICSMVLERRPGVVVEVTLGRPLLGTVLSVFMPTFILLILSQMVRVFNKDYLDMVIQVNLTLLLVLATL